MQKATVLVGLTCAALALAPGVNPTRADARSKPIVEHRVWAQRWAKASPAERAWARRTGACESGNNPHTNTGNGFLGAFQFVASTWWAAPDTGPKPGEAHALPHREPWTVQAVVAIKVARHQGTSPWPVCG